MASSPAARRAASSQRNAHANDTQTSQSFSLTSTQTSTHTKLAYDGISPSAPAAVKTMRASVSECKSRMLTELTGVVANMRRQGGAVAVSRAGGDGSADRELSGAAMALHVCRQHWGMLENDLSESVSTQEHTIANENAQMRAWLSETQSLVEELSSILFSSRTPHYTPPQAANESGRAASGEGLGAQGGVNNNNSSNKLNTHQSNQSPPKITSSGTSKGHTPPGEQDSSSSSSLPQFTKLVNSVRAITHKAKSLQQELYAVSHREDFGPPPSTWLEDKNSPNPHSSPHLSSSADNNNKSTNNNNTAFGLSNDTTTFRGEVAGRDEDDGIMDRQTRRGAQHHQHEWVTTDLSLETLVRLAEDKQLKATRHILSRALENNTNNLSGGGTGGAAIDVAEALKEMSQDLRVQLSRVQKELEEERHQSVAAAKAHKEALVKTEARYESIIGDLKRRQAATVEKFTKTIAGQQEITVSNASQMWENIMIEFATRLSNFRGSELSRAVAMESLKEVLLAERQKVEGVYELPDVDMAIEEMLEEERRRLQEEQLQRDKEREAQLVVAAALGSTAAAAVGGGNSFYYPTDDDPHSVWSPQSTKTVAALSTLVKSRQSELNIVLAGHRASLRVTGLEWESALHDVILKYEAALAHLRETSPQAVLDNLKKNVSDLTEELEETRVKYSEVLKDFVEARASAEAATARESMLRSNMESLASQLEEAKKVAARRVSVARDAIGQVNTINKSINNPVAGEVNTISKSREDVLGNDQTAASTVEQLKSSSASANLSPFVLRLHKASQTTDNIVSPADTATGLALSLLPTSAVPSSAEVPVCTDDGVTNALDLNNGEARNPSLLPSDIEASIHPPQGSFQQNGTGYCACGRPYPPPTEEAPNGTQRAQDMDTPSSEALGNQGSGVSSDRRPRQQETSPRLSAGRRMQTENEEHPTSGRIGPVHESEQSKSRKEKEAPMRAGVEGAGKGAPQRTYNDVRNQPIGVNVTNPTNGQERTSNTCIGAHTDSTGVSISIGGEKAYSPSLELALPLHSNALHNLLNGLASTSQTAAPFTTRRSVMNPLPENTTTTTRAADTEAELASRRKGSLSSVSTATNREVSQNSAGSKVPFALERPHSNMPTHGGAHAVDGASHLLVEHLYHATKHTPYSRQPSSLDVALSRLLGEERFYSWLCKTASMLSYYSVRDAKAQGGASTSVGRSNDVFLRSVRPFAPKHCYVDAQRPPIRPITLVEATAMMHSCILLSNDTAETYYSDSRCSSGLAELQDLLESLCRQCAGHGIWVDLRSVPPNIISDYLSNPAGDSAMRPVIMAPLFNTIVAIVKQWHVVRVRGGGGTWEDDQGGEALENDGRAMKLSSAAKAADGIARTRGGKAIHVPSPPPSAPSSTSIITVSNRSVGSLVNDRPGSARYIHHFVQAQKIRAASSARSASANAKEGSGGCGGAAVSLPRLR